MTVQSTSGELSLTNVGEQSTHAMYVIVSLTFFLQDKKDTFLQVASSGYK
jgi:hypothetical protein